MANCTASGFEAFYAPQYQLVGSDRQMGDFHSTEETMDGSRTPALMGGQGMDDLYLQDQARFQHNEVGNYAFTSSQNQGLLASSAPSAMLSSQADLSLQGYCHPMQTVDLDSRMSNIMLSYDLLPTAGSHMPMSLETGSSYAHDIATTYATSSAGLGTNLDQFPPTTFAQSPHMSLNQTAGYAGLNTRMPLQSTGFGVSASDAHVQSAQSLAVPSYNPAASRRVSRPKTVRIQPKKATPMNSMGESPIQVKPEPYKENPLFPNIYSSSGFDIMGILARVASRPNPKINIGAVDLSCAFVLCDITRDDHPIVYVSDAFERLTGYTKDEIVGRNCRFLQGPDGQVQAGMTRKFVDNQTAFRLKSTIDDRTEIQVSLINYRKGGQPFMNLITMIPIRSHTEEYKFYVGFQVDLVEKPDAVTRRNPNGTFMINYQRDQLPTYIVPPSDMYRVQADLTNQFGHDQVSAILNTIGVAESETSKYYLDRILVENSDDVIHVLSFDCEFLYLSPSCSKILEYDPNELVGKTLSAICHPSDIGPVIRDLRASTTTAPVSVVYRIRKKYSGYMWFESHGSWHIEPDRGREYLVLSGRERPVYCLDRIAAIESDGFGENDLWAKLSLSGMILFMSSKARPVLGRQPGDLIGTSIQDLMGAESKPEILRALETCRSGRQATLSHQMCHRKGHALQAQTTLYPGDAQEGSKPSFLVAQFRFMKSTPPVSHSQPTSNEKNSSIDLFTGIGTGGLPPGNQSVFPLNEHKIFAELKPTRGSSWQFELRELEKKNRVLSDELSALLSRKKKRKRKKSTVAVEKSCAMCHTKNTPEWRRGPSGNRDLCNSCGLRWAKQVRGAAQNDH